MKKKIIIFGATGNVGSYLVDYANNFFNKDEYEVIATGSRSTNFFDRYGIKYYSVDITKEKDFDKLPKDNVHAIVFLSGILPAYIKEDMDMKSYFEINTIGGYNALEYARKNNVTKFIYSQTIADLANYYVNENVIELKPDLPRKLIYNNDHTIYAISKCAVVDLTRYYFEKYGLCCYIFRLPNIYMNTRDDTYKVDGIERKVAYRIIIDNAIKGKDIEVWGDKDRIKDIVYVADFCQMVCKSILSNVKYGTYNVGTGIGVSLDDQVKGIIEVFGNKNHKSKIIYCKDKPNAPQYVMNVDNAKKDFGYIPQYDYIKYLKELKKEIKLDRFKDLK